MAPSSTTTTTKSSLLIKGFLPVRLKLPGCNHYLGKANNGGYNSKEAEDETFFFVKPHVVSDNANTTTTVASSNKALFVVNVPVVPGIRTKILLKALLGRFGDVERVTVVDNPRNNNSTNKKLVHPGTTAVFSSSYCPVVLPSAWSKPLYYPTSLPPVFAEGKFAHVEFTSAKEMKRAMKVLKEIMSEEPLQPDSDDDDNTSKSNTYPGLRLEKLEIQTLMDETQRQYRSERQGNDQDDDDDDDETDVSKPPLTGILAVVDRYRNSFRHVMSSRSAMLEECNAVMQEFEDAEEANQQAREAAAHTPDDDGFVTVSYSNSNAAQELEMAKATGRRANKRSRTKKDSIGATQLPDFYRFQRKENKKRDLQELRMKFEEDLAKVKRMKEDQQYKPFKSS